MKYTISNNPSPSGDELFNDPENIAVVLRGMEEARNGMAAPCTDEDIRQMLGIFVNKTCTERK